MKRGPLRRTAPLRRSTGRRRPKRPAGQPIGPARVDMLERWYWAMERRCQVCGDDQGLEAHHIVYRQAVERAGGDVWDVRNRLVVCHLCHFRHHSHHRLIPLRALPDKAFEFAAELLGPGKAWGYLARRYQGPDYRLDELAASSDVMIQTSQSRSQT